MTATVCGLPVLLYAPLYAPDCVSPRATNRANSLCLCVSLPTRLFAPSNIVSTGICSSPSLICFLLSLAILNHSICKNAARVLHRFPLSLFHVKHAVQKENINTVHNPSTGCKHSLRLSLTLPSDNRNTVRHLYATRAGAFKSISTGNLTRCGVLQNKREPSKHTNCGIFNAGL